MYLTVSQNFVFYVSEPSVCYPHFPIFLTAFDGLRLRSEEEYGRYLAIKQTMSIEFQGRLTDWWPSKALIVWISTPSSSRRMAKLWRSVWKWTLTSPNVRIDRWKFRCIVRGSAAWPSLPKTNMSTGVAARNAFFSRGSKKIRHRRKPVRTFWFWRTNSQKSMRFGRSAFWKPLHGPLLLGTIQHSLFWCFPWVYLDLFAWIFKDQSFFLSIRKRGVQ